MLVKVLVLLPVAPVGLVGAHQPLDLIHIHPVPGERFPHPGQQLLPAYATGCHQANLLATLLARSCNTDSHRAKLRWDVY